MIVDSIISPREKGTITMTDFVRKWAGRWRKYLTRIGTFPMPKEEGPPAQWGDGGVACEWTTTHTFQKRISSEDPNMLAQPMAKTRSKIGWAQRPVPNNMMLYCCKCKTLYKLNCLGKCGCGHLTYGCKFCSSGRPTAIQQRRAKFRALVSKSE